MCMCAFGDVKKYDSVYNFFVQGMAYLARHHLSEKIMHKIRHENNQYSLQNQQNRYDKTG